MSVAWAGWPMRVEPDAVLYLADGSVRMRVLAVRPAESRDRAEIEFGGAVASRQGLNIPAQSTTLPAVPEEDFELLPTASRSASTWSRCRSCASRGRRGPCESTPACR